MLLIGFILLFLLPQNVNAGICNCTGCEITHPVGHSNWCSCCQTALVPGCNIACPTSVYDFDQCGSSAYGRSVCLPSNNTYDVSPPSLPSSPPSSVTEVRREPYRVCNCLLCQHSTLEIGSQDWCRCCGVLFDEDCVWTYRCDKTVFTQSGCLQNNWNEVCTERHHEYILDDAEPAVPNISDATRLILASHTPSASAPHTNPHNISDPHIGWIVILILLLAVTVVAFITSVFCIKQQQQQHHDSMSSVN